MNENTRPLTSSLYTTMRARPRDIALLVISFLIMVLLGTLNFTESYDPIGFGFVRFISILPVVSVAYFFGVTAALVTAGVFTLLFVFEIPWIISQYGFTIISIELVGLCLLLFIFALVVGDLSSSFRQRGQLRIALQAREILISRTLNLEEISHFLIDQVRQIVRIDKAYVLLKNPITGQWQAYSTSGRTTLYGELSEINQTLAQYLLSQNSSVILNSLDDPESILAPGQPAGQGLHSLCARVLYHTNGSEMGRLILVNKIHGFFYPEDIDRLDDLVSAAEKAIEHAYRYARTDYALERQINQLAAIQRASQELNALLDPKKVVDLTLSVALEITRADSGVILLDMEDLIKLLRTRGGQAPSQRLKEMLEQALKGSNVAQLKVADLSLPFLFKKSVSQMACFINHGSSVLGLIVVESEHLNAFDQTSEWILSLLADHAATSLANARLFQEIVKEKQQSTLIVQSVTDGLLTTDRNGRILSANPAAQTQIGLSADEIIGRDLCETLGWQGDLCNGFRFSLQDTWNHQRPFQMDLVPIHPPIGKRHLVTLSAAPLNEKDHEPFGIVILLRDLTEKEELNRLQEELISSMSHEMRTPLAKIQSIAEMIVTQMDNGQPNIEKRYMDTLTNESQRLAQFLDRILDVHELETQQFEVEPRPLPLGFVVENMVEEWRILAPDAMISFHKPESPVWVMADENALNSVISNLVENSIKYSREKAEIEVHLEVLSNGQACISVNDHGPGILAEYQPYIFDRFYRVSGSDAQEVYGHGIGLYLTKMLVEAMGGKIRVDSQPGQGSQFYFTLPLLKEISNET